MAKKIGLKTFACKGGHWGKRGRKTVCIGGRRVKKTSHKRR
jgi:hypothetical protein